MTHSNSTTRLPSSPARARGSASKWPGRSGTPALAACSRESSPALVRPRGGGDLWWFFGGGGGGGWGVSSAPPDGPLPRAVEPEFGARGKKTGGLDIVV